MIPGTPIMCSATTTNDHSISMFGTKHAGNLERTRQKELCFFHLGKKNLSNNIMKKMVEKDIMKKNINKMLYLIFCKVGTVAYRGWPQST